MSSSPTPAATTTVGIKCLIQRVNSAQLLVDNKDEWVNIGFGAVVYVCFLKGCTNESVEKAAKALYSIKVFKSAKDSFESTNSYTIPQLDEPFDIMIVPMASMGGKLKGSTVQYHSNVSRDVGKELYQLFISECKKHSRSELNQIVNGTYGNRQGLKFEAELGPFTHVLEF